MSLCRVLWEVWQQPPRTILVVASPGLALNHLCGMHLCGIPRRAGGCSALLQVSLNIFTGDQLEEVLTEPVTTDSQNSQQKEQHPRPRGGYVVTCCNPTTHEISYFSLYVNVCHKLQCFQCLSAAGSDSFVRFNLALTFTGISFIWILPITPPISV